MTAVARAVGSFLAQVRGAYSKYVVTIAALIDNGCGEVIGTGSIIRFRSDVFLLTAAHVLTKIKSENRGMSFSNGDGRPYIRMHGDFLVNTKLDVALYKFPLPLGPDFSVEACPETMIAASSACSDKDILFVFGFPGEESRFSALLNGIRSKSLTYGGKPVISGDSFFDPLMHLGMTFDPTHVIGGDGEKSDLPKPSGLSGSPVWRIPWMGNVRKWETPDARIVGVSLRFDERERCIVALRIESIWELLRATGQSDTIQFS
ncbi:MAG TPA: hypothetical protein VMR33_23265 [Candidatus Baltobacteraceae bacterium]|nr:hypothetical protein [Candidatus Baltobacteraceae bacterium]